MCLIGMIAARSKNNVIGNNNQLPWHLPADLRSFKTITSDKIVIMGRKTYESIGKPLPSRVNIVITGNSSLEFPSEVIVALDPKEAVKKARMASKEKSIDEAWVIGGSTIYKAFIKRADKMILTTLDNSVEGDIMFPTWRDDCWKKIKEQVYFDPKGYIAGLEENKGIQYIIEEYERVL